MSIIDEIAVQNFDNRYMSPRARSRYSLIGEWSVSSKSNRVIYIEENIIPEIMKTKYISSV